MPVVRRRLIKPWGKVTPGGKAGEPERLLVAIKPELLASTTQPLAAATSARPVPLPVAVDALGAEQLAVVPPFEPVQLQVQGEPLVTALAVPLVHSPVLGAKAVAATLAQVPLTTATGVTPAEALE